MANVPRIFTSTYYHTVTEKDEHIHVHEVPYLISYPSIEVCASREEIPLLLFLHGQSSRGDDIMQVATMAFPGLCFPTKCGEVRIGLSTMVGTDSPRNPATLHEVAVELVPITSATNKTCLPPLPAIILCPQCPRATEWKKRPLFEAVMALVDMIILYHQNTIELPTSSPFLTYTIDSNRVYVTGMSMGGLGSWMFAARYPDRFAAVVPICGGGSPMFAPILTEKPMWFFHSKDDNVIGVEETDKIVEALRRSGSESVQYTRYHESNEEPASATWMVGHNCWSKAYRTGEMWEWLFSKSLCKEN